MELVSQGSHFSFILISFPKEWPLMYVWVFFYKNWSIYINFRLSLVITVTMSTFFLFFLQPNSTRDSSQLVTWVATALLSQVQVSVNSGILSCHKMWACFKFQADLKNGHEKRIPTPIYISKLNEAGNKVRMLLKTHLH